MTIPFEFDKPRNLRLDFRAIKELEGRLGGESTARIVQRLQELSLTTVALTLWVALKHEEPSLTLAHTDRILEMYFANGGSMQALLRVLNEALLASGVLKSDDDGSGSDVLGNGQTAATT